jgi:acyl carrier protein
MAFARLRLAARNLRSLRAEDRLPTLRAMSTNGWTRERLTDLIHRILRDDLLAVDGDFSPRSNLIESGLDSLAVTQLMLAIEEATGVWTDESLLTPENLATAETLAASIYEYVAGPQAPQSGARSEPKASEVEQVASAGERAGSSRVGC